MCGIYGQINRKRDIDQKQFIDALSTLESRGPDDVGMHFDKNIGLGHRRLSIVDLSESGNQPMFSSDGNIGITFNGEIYNYKEIKEELGNDFKWNSRTDTEVLINAYRKWGEKGLLDRIEGMFSFCLYNKEKEMLIFARDHFGKKPLYYYLDEDTFCFASELKAIIKNREIKKKIQIDKLSLSKYLFYGYVPSPSSIFDKIKKLEPSTTLQFDIKNWKIVNKRKYWNLENIKLRDDLTEEQILKKVEDLIKKSVEKRLMSDVPLGIFLSGGVDSSLVAAYLSQLSKEVNSFTVCYRDYPKADESQYAERVAKKLGLKYNLCFFEDNEIKENFLQIMDYLDEPVADAAITPLYFISKFSKDKITVALSGDGGDEIFGGYPKYKAQNFIENNIYLGFFAKFGKYLFKKDSAYFKLLDIFNKDFSSRQFIFGSGSFLPEEVEKLVKGFSFDEKEIFSEALIFENEFKQKDIVNKSMFMDCKIQLPDWYLVKGDRATMSNSLEMRNPLLDKELSEFMFSLGGEWKIRNGEQKYILKKLASKYVDNDVIYRDKKGFGVPLRDWIKKDLKDIFEDYLFINNGYFDLEYIRKMHGEHVSGKFDHQFKLLRIFCFNFWFKKYYE